MFYEFRKGIVLSLVKLLENKKDWKNLIEISKFSDVIKMLGERNLKYVKNAILKAIEMQYKQDE